MGVATKTSKKSTKDSTGLGGKRTEKEKDEDLGNFPCLIAHNKAISLVWGIITCITLWSLTVAMIYNIKKHKWAAYYMLLATLIITMFELFGMIIRAVPTKYDSCSLLRFVDNWKKTLLYLLVALPCFLPKIVGWISVFCGILIVSLAAAYLLSSCKRCQCLRKKKTLPEVDSKGPSARRERHRPITMVDMSTPTTKLINYEIQSPSEEFTPAGVAYNPTGHTTLVQPPREDSRATPPRALLSDWRATANPEQHWRRANLYRAPMTQAVASDPRSKTLHRPQ